MKNIKNVNSVILEFLEGYNNIRDDILQKRRVKYARLKDSDERLKALEEKLGVNYILT